MSFSINPLTFASENLKTEKDQQRFLFKLSQLLSQITAAISNPVDLANPAQVTASPWTVFTCTLTSGAGTITSQTSTASFLQIGKLIFANGQVQVTNIGTASGAMFFSLPVSPKRAFTIAFREVGVTGQIYSGTTNGQRLQVLTTANANPTWVNNFTPTFTFSYEAA